MNIHYPAIIQPQEDGRLLVRFVDFNDTFSEGATFEEAHGNGVEVLSLMLSWRLDNDMPIPLPSHNVENAHYVSPTPEIQAALKAHLAQSRPDSLLPPGAGKV